MPIPLVSISEIADEGTLSNSAVCTSAVENLGIGVSFPVTIGEDVTIAILFKIPSVDSTYSL